MPTGDASKPNGNWVGVCRQVSLCAVLHTCVHIHTSLSVCCRASRLRACMFEGQPAQAHKGKVQKEIQKSSSNPRAKGKPQAQPNSSNINIDEAFAQSRDNSIWSVCITAKSANTKQSRRCINADRNKAKSTLPIVWRGGLQQLMV